MIEIYTDGSSKPYNGQWVGAIAVHIYKDGELIHSDEHIIETATNNMSELFAVINGMLYCHQNHLSDIHIYTDSQYVLFGFERIKNQKPHNSNKEIWKIAEDLSKLVNVEFHKVKAHADNQQNNNVDKQAYNALQQYCKTE